MTTRPVRRRGRAPAQAADPVAPVRRTAVIYCRVSSRDQEREGFSIPAQQKLLREYADRAQLHVLQEFIDVETAKRTGRQAFTEMLTFLRKRRTAMPVVLVEKTDRLYRNLKDWVTLDEMQVEVHLVKENVVIAEESRSSEKFMHGIKVLMAKNYVDNLSEEVRKGMEQKCEEGHWPSSAPFGYVNRREGDKSYIVPDPERAVLVRNLFQLYADGTHSIEDLAEYAKTTGLRGRRGGRLSPGQIHAMLRKPIYAGEFDWGGKHYQGRDPVLVSRDLWQRVQDRLDGHPDTRPAPRSFAFGGLLTCGHCGAAVCAEMKKAKYVYYRCAQLCTKDQHTYVREEKLAEALAETVIRPLTLPPGLAEWAVKALRESRDDVQRETSQRIEEARGRFDRARRLIDAAYEDKLEGKISDEFFERKRREWEAAMNAAHEEVERLTRAEGSTMDLAIRVLELANRAYDAYIRQGPFEQRRLLNVVLSNCEMRSGQVFPTYRKAFAILADLARASNESAPGSSDPGASHPVWSA